MRLLLSFFAFILILTPVHQIMAKHDATGMDAIFQEIGWRKPAAWSQWNQTQKFDYLESIGLYPARGQKYHGRIDTDLSDYFAYLGTTQPANWTQMTASERQDFVDTALAQKDINVIAEEPIAETVHISHNSDQNSSISWRTYVALLIACGVAGFGAYQIVTYARQPQ
jgi:hypothetical protein